MKPCKVWRGYASWNGYGLIKVRGKQRKRHRVAFENHWGVTLPSWIHVLHECDNPPCYEVEHLFLGTADVNQADMTAKGRHRFGERNGRSRLTEETAVYAMARLLAGEEQQLVAAAFNVGRSTIGRLWRGEAWDYLFAGKEEVP